jgi:hypothetical protein
LANRGPSNRHDSIVGEDIRGTADVVLCLAG